MPKKPKFKPEITRVALNPEQAVLVCNCYDTEDNIEGTDRFSATYDTGPHCVRASKPTKRWYQATECNNSTEGICPYRVFNTYNALGAAAS